MSSVGLTFVGAALFVNGLLLLGKVEPRSAGVFNLFVGALQTAIPFYLIATASTPDEILGAAGIFLFGFTYLYVGIGNLAGLDVSGLGWYSAWVAVMATGFAVVNAVRFDDVATALLWAQWAVLWTLFWLVMGLGRTHLTELTGRLTLVLSFTTCTIPGFVLLLGEWAAVPVWAVGASIAVTVAVLAPTALRAGGQRQVVTPESRAEPLPAGV